MREARVVLLSLLFLWAGGQASARALEAWEGCVLAPWAYNDGDSFLLRTAGGQERRVRLYFVDAPETSADSEADQRRVRSQTAYFGLPSAADTIEAGLEAAAFTAALLERPFTVYTAEANASGRGSAPRIYAFVRTAEGRDLGEWLVAAGWARAHGVGRMTPEGIHRDEFAERLRDLELAAAMRRAGVWQKSDPDLLVERRALVRKELAELEALRLEVLGSGEDAERIDPNTASVAMLQTLPGIGPALAERMLIHRPYESLEDLQRVPGIGPVLLKALRDRLVFPE